MNKKCRIINGRRVCSRKSYNPFKLWESYIMLLVTLFIFFIVLELKLDSLSHQFFFVIGIILSLFVGLVIRELRK